MNLRELLNLKWASMLMDEQRKRENEDKIEIQTAYFRRETISDDEIKTILGRQWRVIVGQMSSLAKWCIKRPNPNYFELNTTKGEFATIGSQPTVSRLVAKAEQLEMITCIDKTYHFGSDKATKNYGKKYAVNVPVARDVINFYKNSQLNGPDNSTDNGNGIINDSDCDNCLISIHLREEEQLHYISIHLRENQNAPYKIRGTYNDSDLTTIESAVEDLYTRYPFIVEYQSKTALRNETYYKDVEMMQQRMTPTYNTRKQSVGFRCFSSACRTKKGIQRELEVFEPYLGTRHPYEYDVKASIYNVTKAINTGIWTGDDDIYRIIAGEDLNNNQRKALKAIVQQLYFEKNPNRHAANVASKLYGRQAGIVEDIKPLTTMLYDNMQSIIGKIWGSEIFIIESCLYADVLDCLLADGLRVVQVYDCFYSDDSRLGDKVRYYLPICLEKFLKKLMNENDTTTTNTDNDLDDLESYLANMSWREIEALGAPSQPRSRYGADTLTFADCEEALGLTSEINEDAVETPCEDVMEKNTTESVERPQEAIERETEAVLEDNVEPVVEQTEVKPVETVKDDDETIEDVLNQIAKDYDLAHAGSKTTPVKAMDDDALDALIDKIGVEGGCQKYKETGRSQSTKWTKIDISRHDAPQRGQNQYKKAMIFALNH